MESAIALWSREASQPVIQHRSTSTTAIIGMWGFFNTITEIKGNINEGRKIINSNPLYNRLEYFFYSPKLILRSIFILFGKSKKKSTDL